MGSLAEKLRKKQFLDSYSTLALNQDRINPILLNEAKKRKEVVYGAQAMNIQLNPLLRRPTPDIDLYDRNPKKAAQQSQAVLDRKIAGGRDDFFAKRAKHHGTFRVMHEGPDGRKNTNDDVVIADYSKMPKTLQTVTFQGVKYERLQSIKRNKRKILRDKNSAYRHEKDRVDLNRIAVEEFLENPFKIMRGR
jgi:hypothetical protein